MTRRALSITLCLAIVISVVLVPLQSTSARVADRYRIEWREGQNSHLDDLVKYGEFLILYELLKTVNLTISPGQGFEFANQVSQPLSVRWGKYSAGGSGSLSLKGKVVPGDFGIPVLEGTMTFSGDIIISDGNSTLVNKEEKKISTTAKFSLVLYEVNQGQPQQARQVQLVVGGLERPATTNSKNTTYYKDGRISTSERTGSVFGAGFLCYYIAMAEDNSAKQPQPASQDKELVFTGTITDFAGRPMKHMEMTILARGKKYKGTTDEQGSYRITSDLTDLPSEYQIHTTLRYKKGEKEYFALTVYDGAQHSYFIDVYIKVPVSSREHLDYKYVLSSAHPSPDFAPTVRRALVDNVTTVYYFMSQVVEFYDQRLKLYESNTIPPVQVNCYNDSQGGTLYFPGNHIFISTQDMATDSPDAPLNREWHEYNHHVMYSLYGKWPQGLVGGYAKNHGGFINASTADSYVEGFAEFMALVISDFYDLGNGSIYPPIANMDVYYKPWDYRGMGEELAVASLLWKLYDGDYAQETGATLDRIWDCLKSYSADFAEVHAKLASNFKDRSGVIDSLFISHGFFSSTQPGNKSYDAMEPYVDANNSRRYESGETFIDLPINDRGLIEVRFATGSQVGRASDASRPERRSPLALPGHYIKTETSWMLYTVEVSFINHAELNYSLITSNKGGSLGVVVPPPDYPATITVKPLGAQSANPLVFSSSDFYKSYDQNIQNGYFKEHDFKVAAQAHETHTSPLNSEWKQPRVTTLGVVVEQKVAIEQTTQPVGSQPSAKKVGSYPIIIGVVVLVALCGCFAYALMLRR